MTILRPNIPPQGFNQTQTVFSLWYEKLIAAGGSAESLIVDLRNQVGYFGFYINLNGDGEAKITYMVSFDLGGTWVTPNDSYPVVENFIKTSGADNDGKDVVSTGPIAAPHIKFKVEETSGTNQINVTAYLGTQ